MMIGCTDDRAISACTIPSVCLLRHLSSPESPVDPGDLTSGAHAESTLKPRCGISTCTKVKVGRGSAAIDGTPAKSSISWSASTLFSLARRGMNLLNIVMLAKYCASHERCMARARLKCLYGSYCSSASLFVSVGEYHADGKNTNSYPCELRNRSALLCSIRYATGVKSFDPGLMTLLIGCTCAKFRNDVIDRSVLA